MQGSGVIVTTLFYEDLRKGGICSYMSPPFLVRCVVNKWAHELRLDTNGLINILIEYMVVNVSGAKVSRTYLAAKVYGHTTY